MDDLKIIKKKYGEEMMHFCRKYFPTILDNNKGLLSEILLKHFDTIRDLYKDIKDNNIEMSFVNYINSFFNISEKKEIETSKTPTELLKEVGYTLYECTTEDEIQNFRKYYKETEELCTFYNKRLDDCHVFFAVKDNVDEIKRENFNDPRRQDEYGTSVISIQFTKDDCHILSIKNRYNHTVKDPDATFSNNLDNIVEGLTKSFEKHYGLKQRFIKGDFEIPGYVQANDRKFYKYNYEINNIYYCTNNVVIKHFNAVKYDEKYLVMDYFILDLQNKKIIPIDNELTDGFFDTLQDIKKIEIENIEGGKRVVITLNNEKNIIIKLDKDNKMISLYDNNSQDINSSYLANNKYLEEITLTEAKTIKKCFLRNNLILNNINLPNVEKIGELFLYFNTNLKNAIFPNLKSCESLFLYHNEIIETLHMPNIEIIGDLFMYLNRMLINLSLPRVKIIGHSFLKNNKKLEKLDTPNLEKFDDYLLQLNMSLKEFNAPKLKEKGKNSLTYNIEIQKQLKKEESKEDNKKGIFSFFRRK